MANPEIKAVLFDFGGVILSSPFDAFSRYEAEHGGRRVVADEERQPQVSILAALGVKGRIATLEPPGDQVQVRAIVVEVWKAETRRTVVEDREP